MAFGLDYAWGPPSIVAMTSNNPRVEFVCRYLARDFGQANGKSLSPAEAQRLSAANISIVVVWETTAGRALDGYAAGQTDAKEARRQARLCGMPDDRPIYFAVDIDASAGQQRAIDAYLNGAGDAIGASRIGVYGGFYVVKRCAASKSARWFWQTYAWSGGQWFPGNHIEQYKNGVNFHGSDVDYDRSRQADFGQWKQGETPNMSMTHDDAAVLLKADNIIPAADQPWDKPTGTNPYWSPAFHVWDINTRVRSLQAAVNSLTSAVAKLQSPDVDEAAIAAAVIAGMDPAAFAEAVAGHLGPDMAATYLDALRARLES